VRRSEVTEGLGSGRREDSGGPVARWAAWLLDDASACYPRRESVDTSGERFSLSGYRDFFYSEKDSGTGKATTQFRPRSFAQ